MATTGILSEMRAKQILHRICTVIAIALCAAPVALAPGCNRDTATATQQEPTHVLTTVYALAAVVKQIGRERVDCQWFVEAGQSLDDLKETPERRAQWRSAELVITRGAADPWTLEGLGNAYQDRRILRIDTLPSTREADPTQYLWLDPQTILETIDEVATRLSTLDPKGEAMFRANAAALRREIIDTCDRARPALDASNGAFLTLDRGFLPLARRFGLNEVRPGVDIALSDPSPYGVKVLKQTAMDAGAKAVFANAQTPVALVRDWESRLGLMVLPLEALGTSAPSGRSTYPEILQYNLDQLVKGVAGTKPTTAPSR